MDTASEVRDAVTQVMRTYGVPGMAIGVTEHGRQTFYDFGVASRVGRQAITRDTLFEIGSISKTFTATLATYAQGLGRLSLNDSPARYFPELAESELSKVTLIHLGTHTAGGFPLQVPDGITTREQLMAYFRMWKPQYPAGSARTYANPSIGLLGMVAAQAMDLPIERAIESELFPRLGLHDSHIQVPPSKLSRYAQGYDRADVPTRLSPGVLAAEAYGVKTTARDLLHFIEIQLDPSQVDAALGQAIEDTRTGYFRLGAMTQDLAWEQYDEPVQLQALVDGNSAEVATETQPVTALDPPRPATPTVWVNKTGSTRGFGAYVAFLPARRAGIVILANKSFPNEARVRLAYRILAAMNLARGR